MQNRPQHIELNEKTKVNPIANLTQGAIAFLKHLKEPTQALDEIVRKRPKDEHGNILGGIDDEDFRMWRGWLEHFNPQSKFGPIFIPTNPKVIGAILADRKVGLTAPFAGNPSTDVVRKLVGTENIFSARDASVHSVHRGRLKEHIGNHAVNVKRVAPIVMRWLEEHCHAGKVIDDKAVASLSAQIMLNFLLNEHAAQKPELVKAIVNVKEGFVTRASTFFKGRALERYFNGYNSDKRKLFAEIERLFSSDEPSYPKDLANPKDSTQAGFTLEQTKQHILALMMVGFDNLQSSLMSLLLQLTLNPKDRSRLQNETVKIDEIDFNLFDLTSLSQGANLTASQKFFMDALRMTPPVWVQARKHKNKERTISYYNDAGEQKSFVLPYAAYVFIPNYSLARQASFFNPFSTGPNACPGRNIAYAAAGVLMANLIKRGNSLVLLGEPVLEPKIALKWKDLNIQVGERINLSPVTVLAPQASHKNKDSMISLGLGLAMTAITYAESGGALMSLSVGALSGLLAMLYLKQVSNKSSARPERFFKQAPVVEDVTEDGVNYVALHA